MKLIGSQGSVRDSGESKNARLRKREKRLVDTDDSKCLFLSPLWANPAPG